MMLVQTKHTCIKYVFVDLFSTGKDGMCKVKTYER